MCYSHIPTPHCFAPIQITCGKLLFWFWCSKYLFKCCLLPRVIFDAFDPCIKRCTQPKHASNIKMLFLGLKWIFKSRIISMEWSIGSFVLYHAESKMKNMSKYRKSRRLGGKIKDKSRDIQIFEDCSNVVKICWWKTVTKVKIFGTFSSKYENVSLPCTFNQHYITHFQTTFHGYSRTRIFHDR